MVIELIDVSSQFATMYQNFTLVKVLKETFSHPSISPAIYMKNIGDLSGNGEEDILVTLKTIEQGFRTIILDSDTGLIWKDLDGLVLNSFAPSSLNGTLSGNLVLQDSFGRLRAINNQYTVDFLDLGVEIGNNGACELAWETNALDVYTRIYLSGTEIAATFESEIVVYLSQGEHLISVSITDRQGVSAYSSIVILNEKGGGILILWIVIGAIVILFVGLKIYFRFKPKDDLSDFGPSVEMEGN